MVKNLIRSITPRPLWAKLRLLRMHYAAMRYRVHRVRHQYGGHELELELVDPMGEGWYDRDWPELTEIAMLKRHRLRPGATVFDLGAHQCVVGLMLAKAVSPNGRVLAVEANAVNAAAGRRNRDLNGVTNCEILHAAVAAESGKLLFGEGWNGRVDDGTGEWGKVEVDAWSIDDLSDRYGQPDVLFIDVEGYECQALLGAPRTLAARPDCFVEVHIGAGLEKFGGSLEQVCSFFPTDVYELWIAPEEGGTFHPMREHDPIMKKRFFLLALGS